MKKDYSDDFPKTRQEAVQAAASIRDEDIDYSDIPELSNSAIVRPVGDRFRKMAGHNLMVLNRKIRTG